jgi:hypothetical protein
MRKFLFSQLIMRFLQMTILKFRKLFLLLSIPQKSFSLLWHFLKVSFSKSAYTKVFYLNNVESQEHAADCWAKRSHNSPHKWLYRKNFLLLNFSCTFQRDISMNWQIKSVRRTWKEKIALRDVNTSGSIIENSFIHFQWSMPQFAKNRNIFSLSDTFSW